MATPRPKRSANAAAGLLVGLLLAGVIALVAVPALTKALNNISGSSPGSLSAGGLNPAGGSAGSGGVVAGPLGVTGTKPAWISLSYSCACPPTNIKSFRPDSFHGQLCPPSAFRFGFDKNGGYDLVFGGCSTTTDWSVCAVAGSNTGSIPPCAVDSSQTGVFADLSVSAANDAGGAPMTGTGNPLDLVIYWCGSGDSLETRPLVPSVTCVGG